MYYTKTATTSPWGTATSHWSYNNFMAKLDEVKEFINYLKVLLVLLLATNVGLIGWVVNNYKIADGVLVYFAMLIILLILIIAVLINRKIIKDIKSLKDL